MNREVINREPIKTKRTGDGSGGNKTVSSPTSKFLIIISIVAVILALIFITIYFISRGSSIKASDCRLGNQSFNNPIVIQTNRKGSRDSTGCNGSSNCQFLISSIDEARLKCTSLGIKCDSFTLTPTSSGYNMQANSGTDSVANDTTDFYIIF